MLVLASITSKLKKKHLGIQTKCVKCAHLTSIIKVNNVMVMESISIKQIQLKAK